MMRIQYEKTPASDTDIQEKKLIIDFKKYYGGRKKAESHGKDSWAKTLL